MKRKIIENFARLIDPWEEYRFANKNLSFTERVKEAFKKIYLWSQRDNQIRYLPALKELKRFPKNASITILEVGSGSLGLSRYTKRRIVGVDIKTTGPHYQNMILAGANAMFLPFKDSSFDLVVSSDMLEHIPRQDREAVVRELFRVAKGRIFLGAPTFETAKVFEGKVRKIYDEKLSNWKGFPESKEVFIKRNIFITEHEKSGLPKEEEILSYINKCSAGGENKLKIRAIDNESLFVWYYAVLADMKYNYARWFITTFLFILFFPLLSRVKFGGCYRKIFIIEKEPVR